jgi:hypothetical protein
MAHPYFALGIEEVGVGEYMRMSVLYFFGSRIATVSDLSVKRHYWVTVCCAGPMSKVRQIERPSRLDKSSSECQEGPSLPTVRPRVYYRRHED